MKPSPAPTFDHTDAARSPLLERSYTVSCWRDVLRRQRVWDQQRLLRPAESTLFRDNECSS